MHHLGLLARIAFICNLFFLVCLILQRSTSSGKNIMVSHIAILGLVLGLGIVNPLSNLLNGVVLLRRQTLFNIVPSWLFFTNLIFLLVQFAYILHTWI